MNQYMVLKELLHEEKPLVVPDAYDMLSAKIIQSAGFKAVQCSGYSFSINNLYKTERALSFEKNIKITESIVKTVTIPVMADGEDGYATGDRFRENIVRFIRTGVAGINIEDQNLWDKNNKSKIVDEKILIEKINIAQDIKNSLEIEDFVLNARTDALNAFEDRQKAQMVAIERANKYLDAGADMCFITGIKTKQELGLFVKEITGPLSVAAGLPYNMNEFDINDCREFNISRVSLPSLLIFSTINYLVKNLEIIKQEGRFENILKQDMILKDTMYLSEKILI